ncbi:hypothetical protein GCM10010156_34600 [Planobispora rosea]|uniref:Uncharacterized protein n=1 Tax=Planobispora rosea TaxID=35762 RepID=A0A8J3WCV5_PLARO|nr:SpoIIE family protein phosphatase [Planobispora rosea]GGS72792.1 hypothetical protein GCM10010156_34600 [Planobispora rosea]GIH85324.1 hypothetical protein Pro02_37320 [Planobispora rosea]
MSGTRATGDAAHSAVGRPLLPPDHPVTPDEQPGHPSAAGKLSDRSVLDDQQRTRFLLEVGARLSASLNLHRCARTAVDLAVPFLADAALVVLPPDVTGRSTWLRATGHAVDSTAGRAADGRPRPHEGVITAADAAEVPGLTEALTGFPPVPSRWLVPAQAPEWLLPEGYGPAAHLLVTPLPGNGVAAGALLLARGPGAPAFGDETEALVRVFAARTGAAISAALLYREQSSVNQVLITGLLPPPLPELDGAELAGSLRASQEATQIGGDFYDVYLPAPTGDGATGDGATGDGAARNGAIDEDGAAALVALGDVCGKGAPAAVLAGQIRHSLRALMLVERRPERLAELLNRFLLGFPPPRSFATMVLAELRPAAGRLRVGLTSAGHPPPLILRRDGTVEESSALGTLLGVFDDVTVASSGVELAPGELCLLYSDGITEAFGGPTGGEMYGEHRLQAALATCAGMPARAVVERLEQLSTEWLADRGGTHDDRALLVIQARTR